MLAAPRCHSPKHKNKTAEWVVLAATAASVGFYVWLVGWFSPHLHLGASFVIVLTAAIIGMTIAGIIPDSHGWRRVIHRIAAYGMAVLYLPLLYLILGSDHTSTTAQYIGFDCTAYMVGAGILAFVSKWALGYYLIFQSLYIVTFELTILSAAYL